MSYALPVIVFFLLAMAGIGLWHARRVRSAEDFALAGRRVGAPVLAGTLVATWIGTGSLFGNTEFTYLNGVAGFFLPLSGILGMLLLAWLAPRVRKMPASSVPQILHIQFGSAARVISAIAILLAYLVIVSYQYRAGAAVAERIFPGADQPTLRIGFAVFIILYTALAGLISVIWTDVVNGIVLATGLVVGLVLAWNGWNPELQPFTPDMLQLSGGLGTVGWFNVMLPPFLLILGDANMYQRFLAAGSPRTARRAAFGALAGLLVLESAIIGIAFFSRVMLPSAPENPGHTVIDMAFTVFPPIVGLLLAATIVAVIVSTADSYLLVCSTTASMDLGRGQTTPTRQRILVVVFGLFALLPAFLWEEFLSVALYAYTLYGASLTPALLAALLRPQTSPRAVVGGMIGGLGTALVWKVLLDTGVLTGMLAQVDPVLPALAANAAAMLILEARK
jgi:SSS family solute:Na+ symporter